MCVLGARTRSSCGAVGDLTALLRRPYGVPTARISERVCASSKCVPSHGVLGDPTASNGDATELLWRCRIPYCTHLGVLHFYGRRGIAVTTQP
jgi:hypothetical protein